MAPMRLVVSLSLMAACYQQEPDFYATFPEPVVVEGPPSGEIDPEWQAAYADDNAPASVTGSIDVSLDRSDLANMTASCTDGEIDAALGGYGEWIETDGYGRVWRPYTTAVGVDFTPYETCGSWVWTDYGWTFACEWDWGWLPFHYGRWGWFDDYWAWQPGYDWSPAWVDWRGGGGYVGWRPQAPIVRDHRGEHIGVVVRDHRSDGPRVRDHRSDGPRVRDHRTAKSKDWQWRFAATNDFGKPRIRSHLFKTPAEALRVTAAVSRAPISATVQPVRAESIMRGRLATATRVGAHDQRFAPSRVTRSRVAPAPLERSTTWREQRRRPQSRALDAAAPIYQPTYQAPARPPRDEMHGAAPMPMHRPPRESIAPPSPPPSHTFDRPRAASSTLTPPSHPPSRSFDRPIPPPPSYSPPSSTPSRSFDRPIPPPSSYSPPSSTPSRSYDRPSSPPASYSPPSSTPSRSYDRPSSPPASYSPPNRSYDRPASTPSSGGGGVRNHRR